MRIMHLCINRFIQRAFSNSDISKKLFFTNCTEMLDFVNFNNGGTCVHWRIMDEMLVFKLNPLVSNMIAMSSYQCMSI